MKLRHISCIAQPTAWPGISRRLIEQARMARGIGLDLEFVVLASEPCNIPGVRCVTMLPLERYTRCQAILRTGLLDGCEAAILRYPTSLDLMIDPLLDRHGRRMISEHHTNEVAELRLVGSRLGGALRSFIEARRKRTFLSRLAGVVAVTEELRRLQGEVVPGLPSTVIGNGIDTDAQPMHGPARLGAGPLRLLWACSEFAPWQGLDRLLTALTARRGGPKVELVLAGRLTAMQCLEIERASGERLAVHRVGVVGQDGLDRLLRSAHLVVGTLALQRKHMREACPLKVREAVARGLPVITACIDPDLPDDLPGILRLPADEAPIDGDALVERAIAMTRDVEVPPTLRTHAVSVLDWRPKLRRLSDFVTGVVHR